MYSDGPTPTTHRGSITHGTQQTFAGALLASALPLAMLAAAAAPAATATAALCALAALAARKTPTRTDDADDPGSSGGGYRRADGTGPAPADD